MHCLFSWKILQAPAQRQMFLEQVTELLRKKYNSSLQQTAGIEAVLSGRMRVKALGMALAVNHVPAAFSSSSSRIGSSSQRKRSIAMATATRSASISKSRTVSGEALDDDELMPEALQLLRHQ